MPIKTVEELIQLNDILLADLRGILRTDTKPYNSTEMRMD